MHIINDAGVGIVDVDDAEYFLNSSCHTFEYHFKYAAFRMFWAWIK